MANAEARLLYSGFDANNINYVLCDQKVVDRTKEAVKSRRKNVNYRELVNTLLSGLRAEREDSDLSRDLSRD